MGVFPLESRAPGSAPYTANSSACNICPAFAAICNGVFPFSCCPQKQHNDEALVLNKPCNMCVGDFFFVFVFVLNSTSLTGWKKLACAPKDKSLRQVSRFPVRTLEWSCCQEMDNLIWMLSTQTQWCLHLMRLPRTERNNSSSCQKYRKYRFLYRLCIHLHALLSFSIPRTIYLNYLLLIYKQSRVLLYRL